MVITSSLYPILPNGRFHRNALLSDNEGNLYYESSFDIVNPTEKFWGPLMIHGPYLENYSDS